MADRSQAWGRAIKTELLAIGVLALAWLVVPVATEAQMAGEGNEQPVPVPWARFDTSVVRESSSLQKSRTQAGVFWTLSDSGNAPVIFALNEQGERLASFEVSGAENHDWESLALDDEGNLYIGDFGNNANRRRNLRVLVVDEPNVKKALQADQMPSISVNERLPFIYPEQRQPPDGRIRNFDGESLFWARGELYLLTKERTAKGTVLYRFDRESKSNDGPAKGDAKLARSAPVTTGYVALRNLGRFSFGDYAHPTQGTATSADATLDGRFIAVLGYRVIFIFERPEHGDNYLAAEPLRIDLSVAITKQCEGIAWDGEDLLLSNEQGELHRVVAPLRERPTAYP